MVISILNKYYFLPTHVGSSSTVDTDLKVKDVVGALHTKRSPTQTCEGEELRWFDQWAIEQINDYE